VYKKKPQWQCYLVFMNILLIIKRVRQYPMGYNVSVTEYVGKLKYVTKCKDSKVKQTFDHKNQ